MHENDASFHPSGATAALPPAASTPAAVAGGGASRPDPWAPVFDWLQAAGRVLLLRRPQLDPLPTGPAVLALLMAVLIGWSVIVQRLLIPGPAQFQPLALAAGGLPTLLLAWLCWAAARSRPAPSAAQLLTVVLLKDLLLGALAGLAMVGLVRGGLQRFSIDHALWAVYLVGLGLEVLTTWVLLCRVAAPRWALRAVFAIGLALVAASAHFQPGQTFWYERYAGATTARGADRTAADPGTEEDAEPEPPALSLDQSTLEAQSAAVVRQLGSLADERPGVVDLYAIGFAPYADEDVFSRETAMVADVMRSRFDAEGRVLRLQNHASTAADVPWATPLNLERAIHAAAAKMNREEDVLFLHLTSHGAHDGRLAAAFWPLRVDPVTPKRLRAWLDAAGVKHRVISISACYSGSWIAPLSGPGTLVMTAADATHTSYGCGRKSELTFFGRAMYDEQLRTQTLSFEQAHAKSREVIAQREKDAGKTDGYSNPQINVGEGIRERLALLQSRLEHLTPLKAAR
jgi:hypothetical protein